MFVSLMTILYPLLFVPFCIHNIFPSTFKTNNAYTLIQTMTVQRAATHFEHVVHSANYNDHHLADSNYKTPLL